MKVLQIKKHIVLIVVLLLAFSAKAQQDPQYTQYMYNMNIINPAYAGSLESLNLNFLARTQWVGIAEAPKTLTLGLHSPVGKNVGLGLSVISDKTGPVEEQNMYADFSYTIKVNENAKLALGLKAGYTFYNLCLSCLTTVKAGDAAFTDKDANSAFPNFGVGAFYYTNTFYLGASIPNLLKTYHFNENNGSSSRALEVNHVFLNSGYVFNLTNDIKLKPSIMVKAVKGAPLSMDFSGNILLYNKLEGGLSYRLDESVSAMVNVRVKKNLRIGYAYDHTLTNLSQFNSGSHEVILLFNFNSKSRRIRSPRFF